MNLIHEIEDALSAPEFWVDGDVDAQPIPHTDGLPPEELVLRLVYAAKDREAQNKAIEDHIRVQQEKLAQGRRVAGAIRTRAKREMEAAGLSRVKDALYTASVSKPKMKLRIVNEGAIPDEYWRIKREVSKSALNEALNSGEIPEGCETYEERTLTVRG